MDNLEEKLLVLMTSSSWKIYGNKRYS